MGRKTLSSCWFQPALCQAGQTGVPFCLHERAGRPLEITETKLLACASGGRRDVGGAEQSNNRAPEREGGCDPAPASWGRCSVSLLISKGLRRKLEQRLSSLAAHAVLTCPPRVPPWARYVGTESARGWALRQHSDEGAARGRGGTPQSLNAAGRRAEPGGGAAGAWLQWSRTTSRLAGELRSYAMRELTPAGGSEQRLAYSKRSINAGSSGFL